jgi:predicted enzyme related to lactoylglutathione lyase
MIKVNEVAFTSYPVTDKKRARDFYERIFNFTPTMDLDLENGFWVEYDINDATLALSNMWKGSPNAGPCIAFEVDDFAEAVATLKAEGVPIDPEPFETPVCHIAIIADPDGNLITIHKRKPGHPLS